MLLRDSVRIQTDTPKNDVRYIISGQAMLHSGPASRAGLKILWSRINYVVYLFPGVRPERVYKFPDGKQGRMVDALA